MDAGEERDAVRDGLEALRTLWSRSTIVPIPPDGAS
jgi:hypothetical protein